MSHIKTINILFSIVESTIRCRECYGLGSLYKVAQNRRNMRNRRNKSLMSLDLYGGVLESHSHLLKNKFRKILVKYGV